MAHPYDKCILVPLPRFPRTQSPLALRRIFLSGLPHQRLCWYTPCIPRGKRRRVFDFPAHRTKESGTLSRQRGGAPLSARHRRTHGSPSRSAELSARGHILFSAFEIPGRGTFRKNACARTRTSASTLGQPAYLFFRRMGAHG